VTSSQRIDHPEDALVRTWCGRKSRVIIVVAAALLATGAFLFWGPIGLGNGPLSTGVGYGVGPTHQVGPGFPSAVEVAAPRPGSCWIITKVVVHSHMGIRHYADTEPTQLAVCADSAQVNAAQKAAESAG
jgi:hypothetical protein